MISNLQPKSTGCDWHDFREDYDCILPTYVQETDGDITCVRISKLCPDCSSSKIWLEDDGTVMLVVHDETCPRSPHVNAAQDVLIAAFHERGSLTSDDIRRLVPKGYRNEALRALIQAGCVRQVGKGRFRVN
jgi:hypothetical protein